MSSLARKNLVQHQVHTWETLNSDNLLLMENVDRQPFVHPDYHGVAFSEGSIKAVNGTIMRPAKEIGRMLETLTVNQTDSVAVVGPNSGYLLALLSQLSQHVTWFVSKAMAEKTPEIPGIHIANKDLLNEWQQDGPFDVVIILGALETLPLSFLTAMRNNGRMWSIIANKNRAMKAILTKKNDNHDYQHTSLFETHWPRLPGANSEEKFSF